MGRGLLSEFPNPERGGCPGPDILRGIAFRKVPLTQAEEWLNHLTSCSPCYRDFSEFRDAFQLRQRRTLLAVAASILVAVSVAGWALVQRQKEAQLAQSIVLDLRNRSVTRGAEPGSEPNPGEPPLEVNRAATYLTIYLPFGSSDGLYDVRIVTSSGESLLTASGVAKLDDHITTLQVAVSLSSARPGRFLLQVRKDHLEWSSYGVVLR